MNEPLKKSNNLLSVIISSIVIFIYFYAVKGISENHTLSNIVLYIGAIFLFLITYLISIFILYNVNIKCKVETILALVVTLLSFLWIFIAFFEEIKPNPNFAINYLRHNMPFLLYILILVATFVFLFDSIRRKSDTSKTLRISIGVVFVVIETVFLYAPNIYNDTAGGVYHATAYCNSIVSVLYKTPYEYWNTSIYGHYGLFYYIPIKVLQFFGVNQWIAITTCVAFFGGICFIAETILIHKLIKNDFLYCITLVANALINTQIYAGQYWQVNPHRLLFPALVLLMCYYYYGIHDCKKERIYFILLWFFSSCSILWNLESGMISVLVSAFICMFKQCVAAQKIKVKIIIKNIINCLLACFIALIIVNIYNKICGGGWVSIQEFIYPIGSDKYKVENLWLPLGTPFIGHYFAIILMLGVICFNLKRIVTLNINKIELMQTIASVLGLGLLTYYMNRAVNSNMSIAAFEIILVLSMLLDKNMNEIQGEIIIKKFSLSQGLFIVGFFILTSMSLSTVGSVGTAIGKYYTGDYNTENLDIMIETFNVAIPEDGSVAFVGAGSAILSSILDREKGVYMIDFEDMNPQGLDYLRTELTSYKWDYVYIDESNIQYMPDRYKKISENYGYQLYETMK